VFDELLLCNFFTIDKKLYHRREWSLTNQIKERKKLEGTMITLIVRLDGSYSYSGLGSYDGQIPAPESSQAVVIAAAVLTAFRDLQEKEIVHRRQAWRVRDAPDAFSSSRGLRLDEGYVRACAGLSSSSKEMKEFRFRFTFEDVREPAEPFVLSKKSAEVTQAAK